MWPDGSRPHPDTVTARFNRLVDEAGVRRIRLHDVRHTYATLALTSGVEPKIVSDRVGHSNPGITFQIYSHPSVGADRAAAEMLGQMIRQAIGGDDGTPAAPEGGGARTTVLATDHMRTAPGRISRGPFDLVAGVGFEPTTSGL